MRFTTRLSLICLALALAACTRGTQAILPGADATATPTTAPAAQATPPAPTSTPESRRVGLVLPSAVPAKGSPGALTLAALEGLAAEHGWQLEQAAPVDAEALIESGVTWIVWVDEGGDSFPDTLARVHGNTLFIRVASGDVSLSPGNVIVIGGEGSRLDEIGFLAGAVAGWVTQSEVVGVEADSETAGGRAVLNGFIHGVRYSCGGCRTRTTVLATEAGEAEVETAVSRLMDAEADLVFAGPGTTDVGLLSRAAGDGLWVLGAGLDLPAALGASKSGDHRVLGSVLFRPDVLLRDLLPRLAQGTATHGPVPYSLASSSISIEFMDSERLTPAVRARMDELIELLTAGTLDTGVDPVTGEVR